MRPPEPSVGHPMAVARTGDESNDGGALSGSTRDRAVAAALDATGGGRVPEAEYADDGGTCSVEIVVESGRHIEVKLDDNFHVINHAADDDGSGNDGSEGG
jgi:hypothetical protein